MTTRQRPRGSYQLMLRAIGAHLDRMDAGRFRLVEVSGGFELILEAAESTLGLERAHFSYEALNERANRLRRRRKLVGGRHHRGWRLSATGRQDFLRALGYELDDSRAHYVLVDELEDNVLVTYSFLAPGQGAYWRKHMLVLGDDEIKAVIKAARERRHRQGLRRR